MDLIIKPTELCNFKCTFCSSSDISEDKASLLSIEKIETFLRRFPNTNTIIINGGDPLMVDPSYYWKIISILDDMELDTTISFTSNLWPFYKKPEKWIELFKHPRVGVSTSFQYGGGRLKGDYTEFTEDDFWNVSNFMLEKIGYRPDFIAVITKDNLDTVVRTVELAKRMNVVAKVNYGDDSGRLSDTAFLKADLYKSYLEIHRLGLTNWEWNTQEMIKVLQGHSTICPLSRECDSGIRCLQPEGDYYSCGAFGDEKKYSIDFDKEMTGELAKPLQAAVELSSLKNSCYTCPLFDICNGCKKTIHDIKRSNKVEQYCKKMKAIMPELIEVNKMTGILIPTPYIDESNLIARA